jgi:hypothetical protein
MELKFLQKGKQVVHQEERRQKIPEVQLSMCGHSLRLSGREAMKFLEW